MSTDNSLHAEKKLNESKYFLDRVKNSFNEEKLHLFSAFLVSWRSVFDILLFDAAIIFDLGLTRERFFSPRKYTEAANQQEKLNALEFCTWWKNVFQNLLEEPLYHERNYLVHRGTYEPPGPEYVEYDETIDDYINYTASVTFRNSIIEYQPFSAHPEIPFVINPIHEFEIDEDCERAYEMMSEIVEEGKQLLSELGP